MNNPKQQARSLTRISKTIIPFWGHKTTFASVSRLKMLAGATSAR